MRDRNSEPRTARTNGYSVYIAVSGFAKSGEKFRIEKIDEQSFKLIRIEKKEQVKE